jgi:hypothetical protein
MMIRIGLMKGGKNEVVPKNLEKGKGRFFGVYSAPRLVQSIVPLPLGTSFLHH